MKILSNDLLFASFAQLFFDKPPLAEAFESRVMCRHRSFRVFTTSFYLSRLRTVAFVSDGRNSPGFIYFALAGLLKFTLPRFFVRQT